MNSSKNDAPNEGKQRWSVAIIRLIGQEFPPKVAEGGGNFTLMMPSRRKRLVGVTIIGSGHPLKTRFSPRTCPTRYQPICCAPARPPLKPQIWPSRSDDHPQEHCHRGSPSAPATTGVHHHWSLGGGPPPHLMKLQEPSGKIQLLLVTVIDPTKSEAPDRRRSSALDSGTTIPCHCGLVELHSPPPTGGQPPRDPDQTPPPPPTTPNPPPSSDQFPLAPSQAPSQGAAAPPWSEGEAAFLRIQHPSPPFDPGEEGPALGPAGQCTDIACADPRRRRRGRRGVGY